MKKGLKVFLIIFASVIAILIAFFAWLSLSLKGTVADVKRIDKNGSLYYAEYVGDYYNNAASPLLMNILGHFGCTAFVSNNEQGDVITARNYDCPHVDKNGNFTGLNIILRLKPEGKYSSLNGVDAGWFGDYGLPYFTGALDDGKTTHIPLGCIPYLCMDGINEKGLTVSILYLDVRVGEQAVKQTVKGKKTVVITQMLRYALDECADCDEVVELAKKYNLHHIAGSDYHLLVSDASGKSIVLEWVNNELVVVESNLSTNFYLSTDDAKDAYDEDGDLICKYECPGEYTYKYRYGYGHGYDRFAIVAKGLESHITSTNPYRTVMTESEAMQLLGSVSQIYDSNKKHGSSTQYSIVYNNSRRSLVVSPQRDYSQVYSFSIE